MLNAIIRCSLQYRMLVVAISLFLLTYGSYLASTLPIDVFPDLDRPRVVILTECSGLATEEVESLVTQPIEVALLGASGVAAVRSQSTAGLNVIYVEFDWRTDTKTARQTVQERLTSIAGSLPRGITPQMTPPSSIMGQIVIAGLSRRLGPGGGQLAPIENTSWMVEWIRDNPEAPLAVWEVVERNAIDTWRKIPMTQWEPPSSATDRTFVSRITIDDKEYSVQFASPESLHLQLGTLGDWVLRPRLRKVPGVAEVFIQGGDRKQYQVLVSPDALLEYGVTLQNVEQALADSNINTSGGFAITGESERPIRILGRVGPSPIDVVTDLERVPVRTTTKRTILLRQVATIVEGPEFKRGDAAVDGRVATVLTIVKQPHVDTRLLTDRIVAALHEVESTLPADIEVRSDLFQLRHFIDRGVVNVAEALAIGAFLVIIILFLFLLNFRTTFITLTAIPLSLVMTTFVFRIIGFLTDAPLTINVMTLGGIAVAIGELVDDAIVDVENIFRRLKENRRRSEPQSALSVVYDASREIRGAIVFGTIVVILAFIPLFGISGLAGRLFAPLGFAYIVAILSSLLVSLTVTPVLSYYLLPDAPATQREHDSLLLRWLKAAASPIIRAGMVAPGWLLVLTWCGVGVAIWIFANLGGGFLPEFDEGSIQINVGLPPGSSLQASSQVAQQIDQKLLQLQKTPRNPDGEILHFVRRTGRAELDEHASPVNLSEYILSINPDSHLQRGKQIKKLLDELKDEVPGVSIEVEQPLAHLIAHMVSGVYAQIAVKIYGDDLDTLQQLATQSKSVIEQLPGITEPVIEPIRQTEEMHIRLRSDDLAFYGVTRRYVAQVLQTALQGEVVSEVLEGQRRFELLIRLQEAYRTNYANLQHLRIDLPDNRGQVELGDLADVITGYGPNALNRENARRRTVIRCNTEGRDLAGAAREIETRLRSEVDLPPGYFFEFAGQFQSQKQAQTTIALLGIATILGMFVTLVVLFPSLRIVLQILNALPTAFIGGVLALYLTDQDVTIAALVGFISLGGIAVRNGILLVTHYVHLMEHENESFSKKMILRGSLERLAPVLMTALTAGIALIPLVIGGNEPGREILYPVATVILGGLVTSTFCEFLIHPGLFWKFSGRDGLAIIQRKQNDDLS